MYGVFIMRTETYTCRAFNNLRIAMQEYIDTAGILCTIYIFSDVKNSSYAVSISYKSNDYDSVEK